MHPNLGNWMAIGREVVFMPGLSTHLVQGLDVSCWGLLSVERHSGEFQVCMSCLGLQCT